MPTIQKSEDLAALLGQVIQTENPIEALKQQGFTFSADLQKQLEAAKPSKALSPEERARWVQRAKEIGPVNFAVGTIPLAARGLPAGEYDFIFGLRLGVVNQVLAALYTGFTWPHKVEPESAGKLFPLDKLKAFAEGIPDGENIQVGALHFTEPPTVTPLAGTESMILRQTFSLDIIDQVIFPHQRVTSLDGVLTYGVQVKAVIKNDLLRFVFDGVAAGAGTPEAVHIIVAPGSPLQPRSPQALANLEEAVNLNWAFGVVLLGKIQESYSISPQVRLPVGSGVTIRVQGVNVRSVETESEGALVVGVLLGPTDTPDEGAGDPNRLINPFTTPSSNVYARVHEELLRKVVHQALDSGELQRQASKERDDLRIDGADIELKTNEIRLILKAHLVDACSFNKDLGFTATKTYRYSVFSGEITVTETQDVNLDDSDVFWCTVLGALEVLIAGVAFPIIGAVLDLIVQIVHYIRPVPSGGDNDPLRLNGVFSRDLPVPGTEVLPQAGTLQSRVEELFMEANGVASLIPDNINTYVYAAFQMRIGPDPFSSAILPIQNVKVELIDQDVPRPVGDDTVIPPSTEKTKIGPKIIRTVTSNFEPVTHDQILAQGTTDNSGQVRFIIQPSQLRTVAGTLVTITTVEDTQTGEVTSSRVTHQIIRESHPDVFFQVTLRDGQKFDTRGMTGGFTLNLVSKRIGSPGAPVVLTWEEGVIVDEHPGKKHGGPPAV